MNISKLNWMRLEISHQELSGRNNIWGKFNEPKLKITGGNTAKETLGCSVSISKESKDMLKQLNEEKKQKENDLTSENQRSTIDLKDFKNRIIIEVECVYDNNRQRLYDAVRHSSAETFGKGPDFDFGKLRSTFEKLRKETESQYTGEKLEEELRLLEADYEYVLADATESAERALRFWAKQGKEEEKTAIKILFGMERNDILNMSGIGKGASFVDSIDTIIQFLLKNAGETNETQT